MGRTGISRRACRRRDSVRRPNSLRRGRLRRAHHSSIVSRQPHTQSRGPGDAGIEGPIRSAATRDVPRVGGQRQRLGIPHPARPGNFLDRKYCMTPGSRGYSITLATIFLLGACSSDRRVGGTIVISSAADADVLFPPLTLTLMGKQVTDQVFDNLADIGPALNTVGDAGFAPRLADRWRWAPDSTYVAFHIDPNAKWHDGVPVGGEDVRFTFRLIKDTTLASPAAANLDNVDSVTVPDSLTAVVRLHQRTPDSFYKVATPVVILPEHLLAKT